MFEDWSIVPSLPVIIYVLVMAAAFYKTQKGHALLDEHTSMYTVPFMQLPKSKQLIRVNLLITRQNIVYSVVYYCIPVFNIDK